MATTAGASAWQLHTANTADHDKYKWYNGHHGECGSADDVIDGLGSPVRRRARSVVSGTDRTISQGGVN
jgi:hypothetical protein